MIGIDVKIAFIPHVGKYGAVVDADLLAQSGGHLRLIASKDRYISGSSRLFKRTM